MKMFRTRFPKSIPFAEPVMKVPAVLKAAPSELEIFCFGTSSSTGFKLSLTVIMTIGFGCSPF